MPEEDEEEIAQDLPGEATDHRAATVEVTVEEEMRSSYIDYAMSVIVGRALPDGRDGLKPVHRRILYAMHDMGLDSSSPHRKSARVVGEVLGKYHPHGDAAAYDTLVRMAQDFSLRYPLVDGQGNFGSIDGDSAAAMRYTEARLTPLAEAMLEDLDEDTVDFTPNFDASLEEPMVLPSKVPNLLVNGSAGIAVGMATNMAPHNLGEVVDALKLQLDDPDVPLSELMQVMPGPDFPTGATIHGRQGIQKAYATGRGIVRMRACIEYDEDDHQLIATEIPYQVNKAKLAEDIAQLVRDGDLEGIRDLRDESARENIRLIVELKRGAEPEIVKNQLYKKTQLEDSFGINNVALVDDEPKVLDLKQLLQQWIDHRIEVVVRRTQYRLDEAKDRRHIVRGLLTAQRNIDEVIETIRNSDETADAREALIERFDLSEEQARAILRMRLSRLTRLEQSKLEEELEELNADIDRYEAILDDRERQKALIKQELEDVKDEFDDERRTEIREAEDELVIEDLVPDDPVVVLRTRDGYLKRTRLDAFSIQRRGGRGVIGIEPKEEDEVVDVIACTNHQRLLFLNDEGIAHSLKAYQIPEGDRYARGSPIQSLFDRWDPDTSVQAVLPVDEFSEDRYLFFATKQGTVKKTQLSEFERININGKIAIRLEDDDELADVAITSGDDDVILVKSSGKGIRFPEDQVRPMGRTASGVRGTEIRGDEEVVGLVPVEDVDTHLLTITAKGKGKRTPVREYNAKNRGAWGIYMQGVDDGTGPARGAIEAREGDELLAVSREGVMIHASCDEVSEITTGQARGVIVQRLEEGDELVAIERIGPNVLGAVGDEEADEAEEDAPEPEAEDAPSEDAEAEEPDEVDADAE